MNMNSNKKVDIRTDQILAELGKTVGKMEQCQEQDYHMAKAEMRHFLEVYLPVHVELLIDDIDREKAAQFRTLLNEMKKIEFESFMNRIRSDALPLAFSS